MEKTRNPITGKNSSTAKNSSNKNSLTNNKRKKLVTQLRILQSLLVKISDWIHENFIVIMFTLASFDFLNAFINSQTAVKIDLIAFLLYVVFIHVRKQFDKSKHDHTWDKISNFKRFTHKAVNGEVYIKKAEFEQAILFLQEVEDFLGKPDDDKSSPVG